MGALQKDKKIAELEQANTQRDKRILALEEKLNQLISKLPTSLVGENISIVTESSEALQASAGQKRPRDDGQPSSTFEPSEKKVLTEETPSRSNGQLF